MARKALSKKLRFEVFKRDKFMCRYCGRGVGSEVVLEVDHIMPVCQGGTNELLNLVAACFDCNRGKSKGLLTDQHAVATDVRERAKLIKEQKEQIKAFLKFRNAQQEVGLDLARTAIEPIVSSLENPDRDIPRQWFQSVSYFLRHLAFTEVHRAAEIAADRFLFGDVNKPYLYFCGICLRSIRTGCEVGRG